MKSAALRPTKFSLKSRLAANLLIATIAVVVLTMIIIQMRNAKSRESVDWVVHTHEVIRTAHQFLALLDAAGEAAQKYTASDFPGNILVQYDASVSSIDSLSKALREMTADNPTQTRLLDSKIIPFTRTQLKFWSDEINARSEQQSASPAFTPGWVSIEDSIYIYTRHFVEHEENLLLRRGQQVKSDYKMQDIVRMSFLSLILVICATAFFTIRWQRRENLVLISRLAEANEVLEFRVEHRTELLKKRNRKLAESFDQIRSLNESIDQHNRRLKESLHEVQFLYDQAPCCYHSVDRNGVIVRMNKTGLNWFGYSSEEVVGKLKVSDLLTSESLIKRVLDMEMLKEVGHLENLEFNVVRKDGSVFPVLMNTIAYYDDEGKFRENRSTLFDISDRKNLEVQLQEANAFLTRLNEEKNRFIGMATHDLKNPVNGIGGLLQLMKYSDNLNSEQLEYLSLMEKTVTRMKTLIENLLDLNRIERGGDIVQEELVDVKEVVSKVFRDFENAAAKKQIDLILEVQPNLKEVETDPSLLGQVLDNLVSNAIKFSPLGKKVWLRVRKLGNYHIFEVEDQGPGIKKEEIPKLFGTFQRLSAQPTAGESSTGLGLSIVKRIVEALHGEIKVTGEEGKGSVFHVLIKKYT